LVVFVEFLSITGFFLTNFYLLFLLGSNLAEIYQLLGSLIYLLIPGMFIVGYLLADLLSGIIHYIGDNYGSINMPILGENFLKPFRMHHINPEDIPAHDFLELNGNNALIIFPFELLAIWLINFSSIAGFAFATMMLFFSLAVFATNQFHQWSHNKNLVGFPLWLQKKKLVLTPENHNVHHVPPFQKYFCITTGWLNPVLTKIRFFETLTRIFRGRRVSDQDQVQPQTVRIKK
jgi:hypothetical protein